MSNSQDYNAIPKQTYLFLGGSSVISKALAEVYAKQGHHIILSGRDTEKMQPLKKHLEIIGAKTVTIIQLDVSDFASHGHFYNQIDTLLKSQKHKAVLNIFALSAIMPDQEIMDQEPQKAIDCMNINFTGLIGLIHHFVPYYKEVQSGTITIFGSVAGDRGRLKNYIYGATKAGLECYASGLRNSLGRSNVHVMLVKPGFMKTPMIKGMKLPPLPVAEPDHVAEIVTAALKKKRNVIYVPFFWWIIMTIIKSIPEVIFKKLSI